MQTLLFFSKIIKRGGINLKPKKKDEAKKELSLIFSDLDILTDDDQNDGAFSTRGTKGDFRLSNIGLVAKMKIASILFEEKWINNNFTYKELDKHILNFCMENYANTENHDFEKLEVYLKQFVHTEVEHKVVSILRGTSGVEEELTYGAFKIYPSKLIDKHIKCKNWDDLKKDFLDENTDEIMIETSVFSSNKNRAQEIANERMENFINILSFFVYSKKRRFELRIGKSDSFLLSVSLINYSNTVVLQRNIKGPFFKMDLKEVLNTWDEFLNKLLKIEKDIWENTANEIEKRLFNSIQWAGRALKESYEDKKFIQAMFGMEALLQEKNKNNVISPSITSQMSEVLIFCLGENYEERAEIEKNFKQLYTTRSNIAHGERTQVSEYESNLVLDYLRHIIFYFLKNDTFKTFKDVNEFIKNEKYKKM